MSTNDPRSLLQRLRIPVIAAPMFLVSGPALVIEQCKAGILGSFPALNARPQELLDTWLTEIEEALAKHRREHPNAIVAPYGVNLIVNPANKRLGEDTETCIRHKVPVIITSLSAPTDIAKRVHEYGGVVLHDVVRVRHAEKALEAGVDGIILVCAGAGGHAGRLNPFAIDRYKQMLVECNAEDIVYTPFFSGVHGSYLKPSIRAAGLDPDNLPIESADKLKYRSRDERPKTWKDIWGAGQGVGNIESVMPAGALVERIVEEYNAARTKLLKAN